MGPAPRYHDGMVIHIFLAHRLDGLFVARATDPRGLLGAYPDASR